MADPRRRDERNAEGAWFVDSTCIACDACRQCAPRTFREHDDGTSSVIAQPRSDDERADAARALLACPVGAIGGARDDGGKRIALTQLFPHALDDGLWYCGYNSPRSYGGNAYLVETARGLVMIDAPRWVPAVERFIDARGGLAAILLTHGDDVGDSDRYAERFGCPVYIHEADAHAAPFAKQLWRGRDPSFVDGTGIEVVPVPGHTRGSVVFFAGDRLFTGDSLAWSHDDDGLMAFRHACWFSWPEQARSLARLVERDFAWVLPGHGRRKKNAVDESRAFLRALVEQMQR